MHSGVRSFHKPKPLILLWQRFRVFAFLVIPFLGYIKPRFNCPGAFSLIHRPHIHICPGIIDRDSG